mmetsp:Transcript_65755/g.130280  ORF Transcript_65755/g.130280 Transcript_65755/m.130280 type:complete len:239 (+) Transcript_65755:258-974(+)
MCPRRRHVCVGASDPGPLTVPFDTHAIAPCNQKTFRNKRDRRGDPHVCSTKSSIRRAVVPSLTSVNSGLQVRSIASSSIFFRAIAIAFTAWLMAAAPIAVTTMRRPSRANEEMAPARTLASVPLAALRACASSSPLRLRRVFLRMGSRRPEWPSSSWKNSGWTHTSIDWDSLRKVRAIAIDFIAWFAACGPIACSVGQSTGARAWAAMSIATSRGLLLLPIFVRLLPLAMRSKKVFDM